MQYMRFRSRRHHSTATIAGVIYWLWDTGSEIPRYKSRRLERSRVPNRRRNFKHHGREFLRRHNKPRAASKWDQCDKMNAAFQYIIHIISGAVTETAAS